MPGEGDITVARQQEEVLHSYVHSSCTTYHGIHRRTDVMLVPNRTMTFNELMTHGD